MNRPSVTHLYYGGGFTEEDIKKHCIKMKQKNKTITLEEGIYGDLKVIAAAAGTNSKNYIEKLVTDHVEKKITKKSFHYKMAE